MYTSNVNIFDSNIPKTNNVNFCNSSAVSHKSASYNDVQPNYASYTKPKRKFVKIIKIILGTIIIAGGTLGVVCYSKGKAADGTKKEFGERMKDGWDKLWGKTKNNDKPDNNKTKTKHKDKQTEKDKNKPDNDEFSDLWGDIKDRWGNFVYKIKNHRETRRIQKYSKKLLKNSQTQLNKAKRKIALQNKKLKKNAKKKNISRKFKNWLQIFKTKKTSKKQPAATNQPQTINPASQPQPQLVTPPAPQSAPQPQPQHVVQPTPHSAPQPQPQLVTPPAPQSAPQPVIAPIPQPAVQPTSQPEVEKGFFAKFKRLFNSMKERNTAEVKTTTNEISHPHTNETVINSEPVPSDKTPLSTVESGFTPANVEAEEYKPLDLGFKPAAESPDEAAVSEVEPVVEIVKQIVKKPKGGEYTKTTVKRLSGKPVRVECSYDGTDQKAMEIFYDKNNNEIKRIFYARNGQVLFETDPEHRKFAIDIEARLQRLKEAFEGGKERDTLCDKKNVSEQVLTDNGHVEPMAVQVPETSNPNVTTGNIIPIAETVQPVTTDSPDLVQRVMDSANRIRQAYEENQRLLKNPSAGPESVIEYTKPVKPGNTVEELQQITPKSAEPQSVKAQKAEYIKPEIKIETQKPVEPKPAIITNTTFDKSLYPLSYINDNNESVFEEVVTKPIGGEYIRRTFKDASGKLVKTEISHDGIPNTAIEILYGERNKETKRIFYSKNGAVLFEKNS